MGTEKGYIEVERLKTLSCMSEINAMNDERLKDQLFTDMKAQLETDDQVINSRDAEVFHDIRDWLNEDREKTFDETENFIFSQSVRYEKKENRIVVSQHDEAVQKRVDELQEEHAQKVIEIFGDME